MLLKIPFYTNTNDGNQCYQVCMQAVLEYYTGKKYSIEEMDQLTRRNPGKWTWTTQLVPVLYDLGLRVTYYSSDDPTLFLGGEEAIRSYFKKDAQKVLDHTDLPILIDSINNCGKYNLFEKRIVPFYEVEKNIKENHVPLMLIDYNVLIGKPDLYEGHMVIVTGFDIENVYYHESGPINPEPNKKISKQQFLNAWNLVATGNDLVMVFGRR